MKLREAIGGTLREIRLANGWTLRRIAQQSHMSLGFLSEVERGQKEISSEHLASVAGALDMDITELVKEVYEYLEQRS
jgi:transcriptional regulator with XRE-family HTH domain